MTVFTPKEVAQTMKVSEKTILTMIRSSDSNLKAIKVGRQWRISEEQLNDYLTSRTTKKRKTA